MNNRHHPIMILLSVLIVLCSCRGGSTGSGSGGDTVRLKYAELLQITRHSGYTAVTINDPWNKGKTLHKYILVPSEKDLPDNLPDGTIVRTPIKRAVITTSVHCKLIMSFGKENCIKGVCDLRYINLPWIKEQCNKGLIADCGNGITPALEKIIDTDADAIIISPFQNSGGYGRLHEWKRPIIEAADYMETSALGRAEWMKFYGLLFGAERQADSIFTQVEENYRLLRKTAHSSTRGKSVILDKVSGSTWYVPGGKSTIGRIIADANAGYPFSGDDSSGSLALPFETILEKAGNTDVWLIRYNSSENATLQSLLSENHGYSQFKSFKNKNVYGCNTYSNTFYEDTPFSPDILLRDLIIVTHPEIKSLGQPKYFEKLK